MARHRMPGSILKKTEQFEGDSVQSVQVEEERNDMLFRSTNKSKLF
jgi:hypothetical protein